MEEVVEGVSMNATAAIAAITAGNGMKRNVAADVDRCCCWRRRQLRRWKSVLNDNNILLLLLALYPDDVSDANGSKMEGYNDKM